MLTLGIDTSNKYVVVNIIKDDKVIYHKQIVAIRKASEITNQEILDGFNAVNLQFKDLDQVVCTIGPGSFTGVRIGLTIAKTLASTLDIDLYTLSSLNYYAGLDDVSVVIDAKSKQVYYGKYQKGQIIEEGIFNKDEITLSSNVIDENSDLDLKDNFLLLKPFWEKVDKFRVKPKYYKSHL